MLIYRLTILFLFGMQCPLLNASAASSSSGSGGSGGASSASSSSSAAAFNSSGSSDAGQAKEKQDFFIYGGIRIHDVQKVSFSPDGKYLAVVSLGVIYLFEVGQETGYLKLKERLGIDKASSSIIAWSPDGQYLAYNEISPPGAYRVGTRGLNIKNLITGASYGTSSTGYAFQISFSFSPNSKWLLCYSSRVDRSVDFTQRIDTYELTPQKIIAKRKGLFKVNIHIPTGAPLMTAAPLARLTFSPAMNIFIINYPTLSPVPYYNEIGADVFELDMLSKGTANGIHKLTGNILEDVKRKQIKKSQPESPANASAGVQPAVAAQPGAPAFAFLKGPVKDVQFSPNGKKVAFIREVLARQEFWIAIDNINQETGLLTSEGRIPCGKKLPLMVWARDGSFLAYSSDVGINLILFDKKKIYTQALNIPELESLAICPSGKWLLAYGWGVSPSGRSELLQVFEIEKNSNESVLKNKYLSSGNNKYLSSGNREAYTGSGKLTFSPTMNIFVLNYDQTPVMTVWDFNDADGTVKPIQKGNPLSSIKTRMQSVLPPEMGQISSILDQYLAGEKPKTKAETTGDTSTASSSSAATSSSTAAGGIGNYSLIRAIQEHNFSYALELAQRMTDEQIVQKDENGINALDHLVVLLKLSPKESERKAYDDLLHLLRVKEDDANRDEVDDNKKAGKKRKR
jgi:WD40 repeat protein